LGGRAKSSGREKTLTPRFKSSLVNGGRITLFLLVCSYLVPLFAEPDGSIARIVGWLFGGLVVPFSRSIPRFDDPPLIGVLLALFGDFLVYSVLVYAMLSLIAVTRRKR